MTLDEAKKHADAGDLNACRWLVEYYFTESNRPIDAFPYSEKLALSGDAKYYGITASLYTVKGLAFLGIGSPTEDALKVFEKAVEWATKSQDEATVVRAKQGLGECYFKLGVKFAKTDESLAEQYYVNAYNTLIDTIGKSDHKLMETVWALSVDELQNRGFNISEGARNSKWSILIDSFKNRETLKEESSRAEGYLFWGITKLGFALLEGKELQRDDTAAFTMFSVAHRELGSDLSALLAKFVRNVDGTYRYQG